MISIRAAEGKCEVRPGCSPSPSAVLDRRPQQAEANPPGVVPEQGALAEERALRERRRRLRVAGPADQHGALADDVEAVADVSAAEDEGARLEVRRLQRVRQQLLLHLLTERVWSGQEVGLRLMGASLKQFS